MAGSALAAAASSARPAERRTARDLIVRHKDEIANALGEAITADHFVRGVLTTLTNTPDLQRATEQSLIGGVLFAAQLRLEIGNGLNQFHLTPRTIRKEVEGQWISELVCVPMIGYQGYVELAYRHSKVLDFQRIRIREGDEFDYSYTTERGTAITWRPALPFNTDAPYKGGVIRSKLAGGGVVETYMHVDQIEQRRPDYTREQTMRKGPRAGETYTPNTPWSMGPSSYESMCDKTVMREHQKYLPKSIEMQKALELDGRVVAQDDGEIHTVLDRDAEFGPAAAAIEEATT